MEKLFYETALAGRRGTSRGGFWFEEFEESGVCENCDESSDEGRVVDFMGDQTGAQRHLREDEREFADLREADSYAL